MHQSVALVPTMGNLHGGHLSLARLARKHADRVVMSIYVNPTQFGAGEDFAAYPRTLEEDRALLDEDGLVDAIFVPGDKEIYPFGADQAVRIALSELGSELCGQRRPGHFDGVATVVCRLLNIVAPDTVVFGRKDFQQLIIIKRVVADLRLPVEVISGRTIRHEDGLAISSRNRYLSAEQRQRAPALHAALVGIKQALKDGSRDYGAMQQVAIDTLRASGFEPDYIEVRRIADLSRPNGRDRPDELIVLAAAWLGKARLIDNLKI
jgi:pantoate--beta-alanine ligase